MKLSAYGTAVVMNGTVIAQLRNISGPALTVDMTDVTTHDGDGWEEQIPTLLRTGPITADLIYDPAHASHVALLEELVDKEKQAFELRLPDPGKTKWSFSAYVTGFTPSMPVEGALTASVSLKIDGKPTLSGNWTAGKGDPVTQAKTTKTTTDVEPVVTIENTEKGELKND